MNKLILKSIRASLLGLMITGTAVASGALAPIGTLETGSHTSIQNELGKFPVSGSYTVVAGDQIQIGESDTVATLALDVGTLYIHSDSSLSVNESNGKYTVELASGSIGYDLDAQGMLKIISSGKEVTPIATESTRSGAVAIGPEGGLVVVPVLGDARAVAENGMVTTIRQGYPWSDSGQGAELTLTQVQTGGSWSTADKVTLSAMLVGMGVVGYEMAKGDKKSKSPSS